MMEEDKDNDSGNEGVEYPPNVPELPDRPPQLEELVRDKQPENLFEVAKMWNITRPYSPIAGRMLDTLQSVYIMLEQRISEIDSEIESLRSDQGFTGTNRSNQRIQEEIEGLKERRSELKRLLEKSGKDEEEEEGVEQ